MPKVLSKSVIWPEKANRKSVGHGWVWGASGEHVGWGAQHSWSNVGWAWWWACGNWGKHLDGHS